ncbi:hypothetical protein LDENG_00103350 [Lucifuga dentata]|nr:hypothetical protein LDENG_00103350 [Lucifuga dentata]
MEDVSSLLWQELKLLSSQGSMDILDTFEIYIPETAEVKSIPLCSLPDSLLRQMGLPRADRKGSRKLADTPEGTWISPIVIRRRGQSVGACEKESMCSLLSRKSCASQGPFRMSFVSSSFTAYKLLRETLPGSKVSAHTATAPVFPQDSTLQIQQDAVVVYRGRVYLSIKKPHQLRCLGETPAATQTQSDKSHESLTSHKSPIPTTAASSSPSKRKTSPELRGSQKKRLKVKSTSMTDHQSDADQVTMLNDEHSTGAEEELEAHESSRMEDEEQSDEAAAIMEPHFDQSWRDSLPGAFAFMPQHQEFDFNELEREETIAQIKAKLLQREAALHHLQTSK